MKSDDKLNLDIQAMRAYAISITFVAHLNSVIPSWGSWTTYFWLGGGVDLFFAMSGFLIVGQLLSLADRHATFKSFARGFWIKRIFRLWPASIFWGCVVLLISMTFTVTSFGRNTFSSWMFGMLNIENFYIPTCVQMAPPCEPAPLWHYWSLSLEEQFYFLMPLVIFFIRKRVLLIVCFVAAALVQAFTIRQWGHMLWFIRSDSLLFGVSVAIAWHVWPAKMKELHNRVPISVARCALAVFCVILVVGSRPAISPYYMGIVSISAGTLIFIASADRDLFARSRVLSYIGARSYSLYLIHLPLFVIFSGVKPDTTASSILLAAIAVAASFAAAEFSYQFVENPLREFGRRLAASPPTRVVVHAEPQR